MAKIRDPRIRFSRLGNEPTEELYHKRLEYKLAVSSSPPFPNLIDFNMGEMRYYGRMDHNHLPVVLRNLQHLRSTPRAANSSVPVRALSVVMATFDAMAMNFKKAVASGAIDGTQTYLSNLQVYAGYRDPWQAYQAYKSVYFEQFSALVRAHSKRTNEPITNMSQFLNMVQSMWKDLSPRLPLTYSSYIKSDLCDIMSTGLAIEIADINYGDDNAKMTHFVDSPNWQYYVNACSAYGFMVDKNYPFRLVIDIGAPEVSAAFASAYHVGGIGIFSLIYRSPTPQYLRGFVRDLIQLYTMCTEPYYTRRRMCKEGIVRRTQHRISTYTPESFVREFGLNKIISLYLQLRVSESRPEMPDYQRTTLIQDTLRLFSADATKRSLALTVFETIVSSTVDKPGSFWYYQKKVEAYFREMRDRDLLEEIDYDNLVSMSGPDTPPPASIGGGY